MKRPFCCNFRMKLTQKNVFEQYITNRCQQINKIIKYQLSNNISSQLIPTRNKLSHRFFIRNKTVCGIGIHYSNPKNHLGLSSENVLIKTKRLPVKYFSYQEILNNFFICKSWKSDEGPSYVRNASYKKRVTWQQQISQWTFNKQALWTAGE